MANQMSLGEFVKFLAAMLHRQGVRMPFRDEQPWHLLFYELVKSESPGKPHFLERLRFDWDGPYPKSQELSEFLQALHWTASVSASNPHYDVITLPEDLADLWSGHLEALGGETRQFLVQAANSARQEFLQVANE